MATRSSKENQSITLQIPEELVKSADLYAELLDMDRATVLLHWLQTGAEREMLQLVSEGELSTGKFVEVMGITYFDVHPLSKKYSIQLGLTAEESQHLRDRNNGKIAEILKASRKTHEE